MYSIIIKYLLILWLLAGCASNRDLTKETSSASPFAPTVTILVANYSAVFTFNMTAVPNDKAMHEYIANIDSIQISVLKDKSKEMEFTMNHPQVSGLAMKDGTSNVTLNSTYKYEPIDREELENSTLRFTIFTQKAEYIYERKSNDIIINHLDKEALYLTPFFEKTGIDSYSMGVNAFRNYIVEDEYIPNSQTIIVEIRSENGKTSWNSGEGLNFLQMVENVLPEKPGESYKYEVLWNGRDRNGDLIKPGRYFIYYTIPAKPKPYFSKLDMQW